jgi:hypothetical protein
MIDPADLSVSFTPWNALGCNMSEAYPQFNDVDDYNNLSRTVYINGESFDSNSTDGIPFSVGIKVQYVSEAKPDSAVSFETYLKRMTVTVKSAYIPDSVKVKHVFSYYGANF